MSGVDTLDLTGVNHFLAQRVIEIVAGMMYNPTGRAQIRNALQKQWPPDRGAPDTTAIEAALLTLDAEKSLEIVVAMVPRPDFMREFPNLVATNIVSLLTVSPDGKPTLLLVADTTTDQALSAVVDAIVSEFAAVAVINDVLVDHERLRALTEAIAFQHANDVLRAFMAAQR